MVFESTGFSVKKVTVVMLECDGTLLEINDYDINKRTRLRK
jgi:hypothetical protein